MTDATIDKIQELAAATPHREICGAVDTAGNIHPVTNIAGPDHHFVMEKHGWFRTLVDIRNRGLRVACIYHSHVDGNPEPSQADLSAMKRIGFDYLIVAGDKHTYTKVHA